MTRRGAPALRYWAMLALLSMALINIGPLVAQWRANVVAAAPEPEVGHCASHDPQHRTAHDSHEKGELCGYCNFLGHSPALLSAVLLPVFAGLVCLRQSEPSKRRGHYRRLWLSVGSRAPPPHPHDCASAARILNRGCALLLVALRRSAKGCLMTISWDDSI